jgi:hypothetical protein
MGFADFFHKTPPVAVQEVEPYRPQLYQEPPRPLQAHMPEHITAAYADLMRGMVAGGTVTMTADRTTTGGVKVTTEVRPIFTLEAQPKPVQAPVAHQPYVAPAREESEKRVTGYEVRNGKFSWINRPLTAEEKRNHEEYEALMASRRAAPPEPKVRTNAFHLGEYITNWKDGDKAYVLYKNRDGIVAAYLINENGDLEFSKVMEPLKGGHK